MKVKLLRKARKTVVITSTSGVLVNKMSKSIVLRYKAVGGGGFEYKFSSFKNANNAARDLILVSAKRLNCKSKLWHVFH